MKKCNSQRGVEGKDCNKKIGEQESPSHQTSISMNIIHIT
jgi:hypothetical protein